MCFVLIWTQHILTSVVVVGRFGNAVFKLAFNVWLSFCNVQERNEFWIRVLVEHLENGQSKREVVRLRGEDGPDRGFADAIFASVRAQQDPKHDEEYRTLKVMTAANHLVPEVNDGQQEDMNEGQHEAKCRERPKA